MSTYIHRCMIVPSSLVPLAQALATGFSGESAADMWTTGLSPTGEAPATHYVSVGMIEDTFVDVVTNEAALFALCELGELPVDFATCEALVAGSDVTDEEPFSAFERLGLRLVKESMP